MLTFNIMVGGTSNERTGEERYHNDNLTGQVPRGLDLRSRYDEDPGSGWSRVFLESGGS